MHAPLPPSHAPSRTHYLARRRTSKLTVCRYDDARGHILCGADDGSVVVRAVSRIEGTRDLSVSLVRFCEPSLEAQVPSRVRARACVCACARARVCVCARARVCVCV